MFSCTSENWYCGSALCTQTAPYITLIFFILISARKSLPDFWQFFGISVTFLDICGNPAVTQRILNFKTCLLVTGVRYQ